MLQILKMTNFSFKISEQKQSFKCYPEFLDFRLITNPVAISSFFFSPRNVCAWLLFSSSLLRDNLFLLFLSPVL